MQKSNNNDSTTQAPDFTGITEDENKEEDEEEEDAEDIFAAFLPHLLPDDAPQFHGDPGQLLRYDSPLYGPLTIMVPHYPGQSNDRNEEIASGLKKEENANNRRDNGIGAVNKVDEGRKLFAHFLWSAAMVVAQGVEDADALEKSGSKSTDKTMWSVKGHRVLELGAGASPLLPRLKKITSDTLSYRRRFTLYYISVSFRITRHDNRPSILPSLFRSHRTQHYRKRPGLTASKH